MSKPRKKYTKEEKLEVVKKMSEVFEVSRSGYYRWLKKKDSYMEKEENLNTQIKTVFEESRSTYGSPRVHQVLQKMEVDISESTVARRMKSLEITPKIKKRFKNTTDSKHDVKRSHPLKKHQSDHFYKKIELISCR